jgi:hypothetical protein
MRDENPHVGLDHEVDLIIERLEARFTEVAPTTVEAAVRQSVSRLEHARVQSFVPLLAEKSAREALEALG